MKKITQRFSALAAALWLSAAAGMASGQFVPKEYSYKAVGSGSQSTINIKMTDLFEYPDGMDATTNLDEAGVEAEFTFADEDVVGLYQYQYYAYGKVQQLYLMRKGGYATGNADVTVKLTYNGQTVENTLDIDIVSLIAQNDAYTADLGETLTMPVISNDNFMRNTDKAAAIIEIVKAPTLGTATIVSGSDSAQDSIRYIPNDGVENYSFDELTYRVTLGEETSEATVKIDIHKNAYATRVIEFLPAPGQFTNQLSTSATATKPLGENGSIISLGGFGGYITFGFDQPIKNDPRNPYGVDFTIKGNSFVANIYGVWTEPGAVQVCKDLNGNGVPDPDEPWYELAGSDYWLSTTKRNARITYYNPNYATRYTVPWTLTYTDKDGNEQMEAGAVLTNQFHQQSYYPDPFDFGCDRDSLTFEGNIIRSSIDMSAPSYIEFYRAPAFGYCDNRGYDRTDLTVAHNPYYNDENGNAADGFDLDWAVDKDGNPVELNQVDFVRIYCAGSANAGWLGEWSTEVAAIGITTPDPDYVPQDYYLNYIGVTQLQVVRGQECQFEGFLFKNGRPVTDGTPQWWLSTDSVGTIDQTGLFTANGKTGKVKIFFTQNEDVPTDSIQIDVVDLTSVLIDLEGNASTVSNDSIRMITGETIYINVQCTDSRDGSLNGTAQNRYIYETFDWTTSDPSVGTIRNGSFHGLKPGRTMLQACSRTNPELSDSILVIVDDIPEIQPVGNPVRLAYHEPEGQKTSAELFTAGNNSTIYLDGVTSTSHYEKSIEKNQLNYKYTQGEYLTDTLTFELTHYGQKKQMQLLMAYGPDTKASGPLMLYSDNDIVKAYSVSDPGSSVRTVINGLTSDSIRALWVDGSFTYMAAADTVYRYNTVEGQCTHKTQLAEGSVIDKMLTARNLLLVASHSAAGNHLDLFYKTDLEHAKSFNLPGRLKDMAVAGDKLYAATETGNSAFMAAYDLKTFMPRAETNLGEKGKGIETLLTRNERVYGIQPYDPQTGKAASILEFNTTNHISNVIETDGIQAYFEGVPVAAKPLAGDSILLANYNGFTPFDIQEGQIKDGILLTAGQTLFPTEAVQDTTSDYTYVIYADGNAEYYQGAVFQGKDFTKESDIYDLGRTPANLTAQPALADNEAPKAAARFSMSPNSYCYEMATSPSTHTIWKNNNFSDHEGDFDIYLRGLEKYPWLTQLDNLEDGDIRIQALYRGTVDKDSVITFQVEAIDKAGAVVRTDVNYTVRAQIVKPTVAEAIPDTIVQIDTDTLRISLADVFSYTGSTYGVTLTKSVSANDNRELIIDSIDAQTDSLVLIPAKGKTGMANLTVRYTVAKEGYGEKYAENTFRVTVKGPTGIKSSRASAFRVLTNPFEGYLVADVPEAGIAELRDMNGRLLLQARLSTGENTISTGSLPAGAYILKFNGEIVKVIHE